MDLTKMITWKMTGKMEGLTSLSTSRRLNPWCQARARKDVGVCAKCYAERFMKFRKDIAPKMERNTEALTSRLLTDEEIPYLNCYAFRFEVYGDLINETQAINYVTIAQKNPQTKFALWTKNPWILERTFMAVKKPKNLQIVFSVTALNNEAITYEMVHARYPFIDKIFTVFDKEHAKNVKINCQKKCNKCMKCYKNSKEKEIKEVLK